LPFDHPELGETFYEVLDTLIKESDRGAVLVGTSLVDSFLHRLFENVAPEGMGKKALRTMLEYPGALSSLAAKTDVALITRLITTHLHRSIHRLRRIRNDVAHSPGSFRLADHHDQLLKMYELGPGIPSWINRTAAHLLWNSFLSNVAEVPEAAFESPKEVFDFVARSPKVLDTLQEKAYRFELALAISMICSALVLLWEQVGQVLSADKLIISLKTKDSAT
jgi:hypothetical protein